MTDNTCRNCEHSTDWVSKSGITYCHSHDSESGTTYCHSHDSGRAMDATCNKLELYKDAIEEMLDDKQSIHNLEAEIERLRSNGQALRFHISDLEKSKSTKVDYDEIYALWEHAKEARDLNQRKYEIAAEAGKKLAIKRDDLQRDYNHLELRMRQIRAIV